MCIANGNEIFLNCLNKNIVFAIYQEHVVLCIEALFEALRQFLIISEVKQNVCKFKSQNRNRVTC